MLNSYENTKGRFLLPLLALALGILAIFFRVNGLPDKLVWHDEVYTFLRVSGRTAAEIIRSQFTGKIISSSELRNYQKAQPDRGLADIISALATEDPHNPPFYFICLHYWTKWWGTSVSSVRGFSVLAGLLFFPALFWLARELFASRRTAWVAVILAMASPLPLVFAQEARCYALLLFLTTLNCAIFLQALRSNHSKLWLAYSVTTLLGLYTSPLFALITIAQCLFHLTSIGTSPRVSLVNQAKALILPVLGSLPWLLVVALHWNVLIDISAWTRQASPPAELLCYWLLSASQPIFDVDPPLYILDYPVLYTGILPAVLLQLWAFLGLWYSGPPLARRFIFLLAGLVAACFVLPDLVFWGQRSTMTRYLLPIYLSSTLALAFMLTRKLERSSQLGQLAGALILTGIVLAGIASCLNYHHSRAWWVKGNSRYNFTVATMINRADNALLVADPRGTNLGELISLAYLLKADTKLLLLPYENSEHLVLELSRSYRNIFILNPTITAYPELAQPGSKQLVNVFRTLWALDPALYQPR